LSADFEEEENQEEQIQREILLERKFTLADAIGREGGGFVKGHNPVPALDQAMAEINVYIQENLYDPSGMLKYVLQKTVKDDKINVSENIDRPIEYLYGLINSYLGNPHLLYELKREVDFMWGRTYKEKPYFQKPGEPGHPDDEYSHEIVFEKLFEFQKIIENNRA
jgi:hypothetical protein